MVRRYPLFWNIGIRCCWLCDSGCCLLDAFLVSIGIAASACPVDIVVENFITGLLFLSPSHTHTHTQTHTERKARVQSTAVVLSLLCFFFASRHLCWGFSLVDSSHGTIQSRHGTTNHETKETKPNNHNAKYVGPTNVSWCVCEVEATKRICARNARQTFPLGRHNDDILVIRQQCPDFLDSFRVLARKKVCHFGASCCCGAKARGIFFRCCGWQSRAAHHHHRHLGHHHHHHHWHSQSFQLPPSPLVLLDSFQPWQSNKRVK